MRQSILKNKISLEILLWVYLVSIAELILRLALREMIVSFYKVQEVDSYNRWISISQRKMLKSIFWKETVPSNHQKSQKS